MATTCRSVLKHVLKSYDIFYDVHDSRKRVVETIRVIGLSSVSLSHATKSCTVTLPITNQIDK